MTLGGVVEVCLKLDWDHLSNFEQVKESVFCYGDVCVRKDVVIEDVMFQSWQPEEPDENEVEQELSLQLAHNSELVEVDDADHEATSTSDDSKMNRI